MGDNSVPEELVDLIHALSEDKDLCQKILGLVHLPPPVRQAELLGIAARMRSAGEDAAITDAISTLAQARFFDAACSTLRELRF